MLTVNINQLEVKFIIICAFSFKTIKLTFYLLNVRKVKLTIFLIFLFNFIIKSILYFHKKLSYKYFL